MTESNRVRLTTVRETTAGVTPVSPRMRTARITGETLAYAPTFTNSEELRDDRMTADPIKTGESNSGPVNTEISYPVDGTPHSLWLESALCALWSNTPFRDNDGTAGSAILGVTASSGVFAVTTGPAFAGGHLIRATGFSNAGNNGTFRLSAGSATAPAVGAGLLTDEASPPATARIKVVGLEGDAGDLVAVSDGITSTLMNFTLMGLSVGQLVKVGGAASANRFANALSNGWARVVAIAANKLTLDNLPTGWAADAGTGKAIRIYFGDVLKNGVSKLFHTIERGFLGQTTPTYVVQSGMLANQLQMTFNMNAIATATYTFMGLTGSAAFVPLDASPDPATTNRVVSASSDVGRIANSSGPILGPDFVQSATVTINNNARNVEGIRTDGKLGPVGINLGECGVEVQLNTYFGSGQSLQDYIAGLPTALRIAVQKDSQALGITIPRLTRTAGSPSAQGKNQDVMIQYTATASKDTLTGCHIQLDRLEFVE